MRQFLATTSWLGVILGVTLVLSTSACASGGGQEGIASSPAASTKSAAPEDAASSPAPEAAKAPQESDAAACGDAEFVDAARAPESFSDLDIPFYVCSHEMAAVTADDPLFVGEYVTNHEMIIVEMAVTKQFDQSDWEVIERSVEGDNAISKAQKPGYFLVVAIGPSRLAETDTSVHYTLRTQ